jgi:predicted amidohydrolase
MRIACLQFDPQVGDIDNNLDRADAILNTVHPDHLNALDLLVLPELSFTGGLPLCCGPSYRNALAVGLTLRVRIQLQVAPTHRALS